MKSKAVFCLSPILPHPRDLHGFSHCLDFLKEDYHLTWHDTLQNIENVSFEQFTRDWHQKLAESIEDYDIYVAFSLGGLILAHCMDVFYKKNKCILLISTPTLIESILEEKLLKMIDLIQKDQTLEALEQLHQQLHVSPPTSTMEPRESFDLPTIAQRLSFGLRYILEHRIPDSSQLEKTFFYQMAGSHSQLVTSSNLLKPKGSMTQIIPDAGMRVLEDNPDFCQKMICQWLKNDA